MDWRDSGFVLSARRHGESALIVELLTAEHGRHAGLVRGGQSPRRRALLQPGNALAAHWRGRLPEHLGAFECELVVAHAAPLLGDPDRLAALNAAVALLLASLPEREPYADVYVSFAQLLATLSAGADPTGDDPDASPQARQGSVAGGGRPSDSAPEWAAAYVQWERRLLAALGFGLDLERCAATGSREDLAYVSPRSGRAVSRAAGLPYHDKLLPLPQFLWRDAAATAADIVAGMAVTRYFLLHHLLQPQGGKLPEAREMLAERLRRHAGSGRLEQ